MLERLKIWNKNRLNHSSHFDFVFAIRNPINVACIIQEAKAHDILIKKKPIINKKTLERGTAYICRNCHDLRFHEFIMDLASKIDFDVLREYGAFRMRFWVVEK